MRVASSSALPSAVQIELWIVEGVGRYFAASLRCGLCDDCGRRSRIAVAAGDDVSVERREGLVDQQGVVYVAARRADIDDDFRGVDFAQPVEAVPEFFVGGYARRGLVELPLLGDADHPFDVHEAGVVAVGDLNVGLHGKLFLPARSPAFGMGLAVGGIVAVSRRPRSGRRVGRIFEECIP